MKKQILLSLVFSFSYLFLLAQDFTINPNPIVSTGMYDLTDEFYIIKTHSVLNNNTNQTANLRWEVILTDVPQEWLAQMCDNNNCYAFGQYTNIDANVDVPLVVSAGDTSILDMGIRHGGVAGVGKYEVRVTTVQDPSTVIASSTYEITVESDGTSSIDDFRKSAVKVFPNPTENYFTLTENPFVKEVQIFNIVGKRMLFTPYQNGTAVNVSSFPNGLYLVRMLDGQGNVLKTTRLTKK